jgi:hypothetical protein
MKQLLVKFNDLLQELSFKGRVAALAGSLTSE